MSEPVDADRIGLDRSGGHVPCSVVDMGAAGWGGGAADAGGLFGHVRRRRGQTARALTLTLRFAGGPSWDKTRRLPEASAHEEDLRLMAYQLIDASGLQRGRLTGQVLKAEGPGRRRQISWDRVGEACLVAEEVSDRIRDKFGPGVIGPAAALRRAS
jgi:DNA polymerase IV